MCLSWSPWTTMTGCMIWRADSSGRMLSTGTGDFARTVQRTVGNLPDGNSRQAFHIIKDNLPERREGAFHNTAGDPVVDFHRLQRDGSGANFHHGHRPDDRTEASGCGIDIAAHISFFGVAERAILTTAFTVGAHVIENTVETGPHESPCSRQLASLHLQCHAGP